MNINKEYKYRLPRLEIPEDTDVELQDDTYLIDEDWVNLTLHADTDNYNSEQLKMQYRSPVQTSISDTSLGGHFTLNPTYGFTPTADVYYTGRMLDAKDYSPEQENINIGSGRYYSEAIEINSKVRTITFEFGVPHFQNIFGFLINAVDTVKVIIAKEGRTPFFYYLGNITGTAAAFIAFPIFTATVLTLQYLSKKVFGLVDPKYYSLKPTMGTYWSMVNTIVNTFAADRGILGSFLLGDNKKDKQGYPVRINEDDRTLLSELMPHIFKNGISDHTAHGLIDVAGIAGRHQMLINERLILEQKALETGDANLYNERVRNKKPPSLDKHTDEVSTLPSYKSKDPNKKKEQGAPTPANKGSNSAANKKEVDYNTPDKDGLKKSPPTDNPSWIKSFSKYYKSTISNAIGTVSLQVEYAGKVNLSINNSVKDIPIKTATNQIPRRIRDIRFSTSDGNILGDTVKMFTNAMGDMAKGFLDGATLGLSTIVSALNGGGYISYPQMWSDSTAKIGGHSFKIRLNTPYNNPISQMMDIDLILGVLLAGASPISIGRSSYTSPLLCKAFMRGVMNVELGIVGEISIAAASGNMGHNIYGATNDLEISFTIIDLEDVFNIPVPSGVSGLYEVSLDGYSGLNRFSKIITGQSMEYTKFISKRVYLNLTKQMGAVNSLFSPEMWGVKLGNSFVGRVHTLFIDPSVSDLSLFSD